MRSVRTRRVEWVRVSPRRRVGYGLLAALLLTLFAGLVSLTLTYGRGLLESALLGATLAGGIGAAFFAIAGKEQRRKAG
jgi:hypothetical protein